MDAVLQVRDLVVEFSNGPSAARAVNGLSLDLQRGEILGIAGESGSGKSATALSVLGLLPASGHVVSGQVMFDGLDLIGLPEEGLRRVRGKRIGFVAQDPSTALNPLLSIGSQLRDVLAAHRGLTRRKARAFSVDLLTSVGIPDARSRLDDYPHQFSGGMKQRICIAMALSCDPEIVLADEPTTALDVTLQAQILALVDTIRRERDLGVILISHDLAVLATVADRIAVMYAGQIVEVGSRDDLIEGARHPYTRGLLDSLPSLDRTAGDDLQAIPGRPASAGEVTGCPFHPRCARALDRCITDLPELQTEAMGHGIRCWNPLGASQ